jgi:hypothetical protein
MGSGVGFVGVISFASMLDVLFEVLVYVGPVVWRGDFHVSFECAIMSPENALHRGAFRYFCGRKSAVQG